MERNMKELIKQYDSVYHDKAWDEEQEYDEILYASDIDQLFKLAGSDSKRLNAEDRLFSMCGNAWKAGVVTGYKCGYTDAEQPDNNEVSNRLCIIAIDKLRAIINQFDQALANLKEVIN